MLPGVQTIIRDGQLGSAPPSSDGIRVVIGPASAGTINEFVPITDHLQVRSQFGYGLLPDALAKDLSEGGGLAYAMRSAASIAGTVTPAESNPSDPEITLDGTPNQLLAFVVEILKAGARGTATFRYSLDGGDTWSPEIATAASYAIAGTSHTLTFANTTNYGLGDTYSWAVTAPQSSIADLQAAVQVAIDRDEGFEWIHIPQPSDNSFWTAMDSMMLQAENSNRYCFMILEAPLPNDGETVAAFNTRLSGLMASFSSVSKRIMVVAPAAEVVDSLSGLQQLRNIATQMSARLAKYEPHINPGWVRKGPVSSVTVIAPFTQGTQGKLSLWNNAVASNLDNAGYATVYTLKRRKGWYWNGGRMAVPSTSDFYTVTNRRLMDRACEEVRDSLLDSILEGIDPTNLTLALKHMVAVAEAPLRRRQARGQIVGFEVSIPAGQNLLSSRNITVRVGIIPLGYPNTIYLDIGMLNPLLEGAA